MFLPGHWSHIFVGCFIEEIAEEKGEPLAPRTKYEMPHRKQTGATFLLFVGRYQSPVYGCEPDRSQTAELAELPRTVGAYYHGREEVHSLIK